MKWRRAVIIGLAATLLLSACDDGAAKEPDGQAVEVFAGGGTNHAATKVLDAKLTGAVRDLEVGRDGVVRLLMRENQQVSIWVFRPDGGAQRIALDRTITAPGELAVADDGTMYVSHSVSGVGLVSKISAAGKATRVIGNGREGFTADGGAATGPADWIVGVTVDRQGRLVYGELRAYGTQSIGLIRRVEANGRVTTIAGRPGPLPEGEYSIGIVRSVAPPAGTKALGWALPGILQLRSLATGADGTIFAESLRGVLAVAPDGTIRAAARRRDPAAAPIADRPFSREGDAADAGPDFLEGTGITEDDGYLTMPVQIGRPEDARLVPPAFRWNGDYTPGQREIIDAAVRGAEGDQVQHIVRLVRPDGSLTTAAWAVETAAVRAGRLYLVISSGDDQVLIGRVNLPG